MTDTEALRHFWNHDVESAIHLATPKAETAARASLIELDEGIYRAESANTVGGCPGLYVLRIAGLTEYITWLLRLVQLRRTQRRNGRTPT